MNKLLTTVIQIALFAATLAGTSASAGERHEASMETANQMCVVIDDKLVCAPMAEAVIRVASSEFS
ncbi:MAG: hypothetical protein ABI771_14905 [Betaproteobacteria bacterium]